MRLLALVLVYAGLGCGQPSGQVEWQGAAHTVQAAVTLVNNPPDAVNDTFLVAEDSNAAPLTVLTNDSTAPDTGETLTITGVTQPTWGTVSFTPSLVHFTPALNFNGTTTFTYTVSDGNGGTDTAMVTVTVTPMNDQPDAVNDTFTVTEDSGTTPLNVLANDSSAPDTGETLTVTAVTQPANGSVTFTAWNVSFIPAANFFGTTVFTYTVSDGNGANNTAMVTVTVTPMNDQPDAVNDTFTVTEDSGTTPLNVLANDSSAPDAGETLTVTAVTQPASGSVTFTGSNVSFTPAANFSGTVTFTYTLFDGNGGTDTGNVTVVVIPSPPVVVTPLNGSSMNDNTPTYSGLAKPGTAVNLIVDGALVSTFPVNATGNWSFTPAALLSDALHTVKATVTDGSNNTSPDSNTNTFIVDTTPPVAPVVLMPTYGSTTTDNMPAYSGSAEPGSTVTVIVDGVSVGTVQADGTGAWVFTPTVALADGSHDVKATATDGAGNTSPFSNTNIFTIDATPPAAAVVLMPTDGSTTTDNTPAYSGSAEPGSTVTVTVDGVSVGTITATAGGTWSFTPVAALADGTHTVRATATDAAGNTSVNSNINTFTVDTTPPAAPVVNTPANSSVTSDNTPTYSGSAEPGSTVTIIVDGVSVGTLQADGTGAWAFTPIVPLTEGPHGVKAAATDGAGNTSPDSSINVFTVDTIPSTGGWRPMGSLVEGRSHHTATLLPDGRILVAGGTDGSVVLASAELYDPNTGSWRATGPLGKARFEHTATLLDNGRVLVTGGKDANGSLTSAELYDPYTEKWTPTFSLANARASHTATLLKTGKVLVTGGYSSPGSYVADAEVYELKTGWRLAGTLIPARDRHTATLLLDGKVLVTGGFDGTGELASAALYDPNGDIWRATTGTPHQTRSSHTATLLKDGKVLITGGYGSLNRLDSVEIYDPLTDIWSQTGTLSTPRELHTATLLPSGKVLVTGGENSSSILASTEIYDPFTDIWNPAGALATARDYHTAMLVSGKVLIIGGAVGLNNVVASTEVFGSTGTSSLTAPLAEARTDFMAVLLPTEEVLVMGGSNSNGFLVGAELYNPVTQQWSSTSPLGTPRASATATLLHTGEVLVAGGKGPGGTALRALAMDTALASAELFNPRTKTWRSTSSLHAPRSSHSAVLLPSGKVMAIGGLDDKGELLATVEVYDPERERWSESQAMNTPRKAPLVVQLPAGHVLVAGGMDKDDMPLASAELYDPELGKWTYTDPMNAPRASSTAVLLPTGRVLVVVGAADEHQILNSAEIYEPADKHWRPAGTLEHPRKAHSALLLPTGNVLVVGGTSGSSALDDVEVFDLSREQWERKSRLTTPSKDSVTIMLPTGQVLVIAGTNSSGKALARAEEYGEFVDSKTPRPVLEPLKAQKPLAFLELRGRGFVESAGRPGMVRVQTLPRGELKNVHPRKYADSSLEMSLPELSEGYHLLFVLVRGIASGRVLHVDGTPPGAPIVTGYTVTPQLAMEGTAEPNSAIQILLGDEMVGVTTADGTGAWSLLLGKAPVDGEYTAKVMATDEAGNPSQATEITFRVDTQAPVPPSLQLEQTPTNKPKPTLSGMAEPLSQITLFVDGRQEASIQAGGNGYWSGTLSTMLEDGPHTAWATSKDSADNQSRPSRELHFIVDTLPPSTPEVVTPLEGAIEPSRTPLISGTADPGSTVVVKLDGKEAHPVTADADGRWSFQPSMELEQKEHLVSAISRDEAGNPSSESTPRVFTVGGAATFGGGGLSCAAGPGDSSLGLLGLVALGRFLTRRRRARAGASSLLLLACVWLGCGPQMLSQLEGFPAEDQGALIVGASQQPLAAPCVAAAPAAGWSCLPGMSTTRYNHTATLLPSGKVLVAGGINTSGGSALNSTQWYDLETGAWRDGRPMRTARYNHTATLLPSGKVLVMGGANSQEQALGSFEVYDPKTDTWNQPETLIKARYYHTATLMPSGEVLVTGGTQDGSEGLPDVDVYDPETGTWHSVDAMNYSRFKHTATLMQSGEVLVIGGPQVEAIEEYAPGGVWKVNIGELLTNRSGHTATLLPSGKILIAGGTANGMEGLKTAELYDRDSESSYLALPMTEARILHTATLLFSGKVLVAGGTNSLSNPSGLSSAEEYDPEQKTWRSGIALTAARFQHAATLLPSGKVLVTGGYGTEPLDSAEVYDPGQEGWGPEVVWPAARSGHAVTLLPSGQVLITGGVDAHGNALDTFAVYDPGERSWEEPQQTLRAARYHHAATLLPSGKVLVTGGTADGQAGLTSVEVYDPTTGIWSQEASMSHARIKHTATLLASGKVLIAGGAREKGTEEYDPEQHTWRSVGELKTNRSEHTATLLPSGKVLITGGTEDGRNSLDSAQLYDAESQQWSVVKSMSDPRFQHTATLLPSGQVLIAGGAASTNTPRNTTELFDPATGDWTPGKLKAYRYAHTATLLPSGQVLIAGGRNNSTALGDAEVYDPVLGLWRATSSLNTGRSNHTATLLPSGQVLIFGGENSGRPLASAQIYEGLAVPNGEDLRPTISSQLPARKPGNKLELTGSHLRSRSEASGGNARSAGSHLPLISLIAVDGGGLTRIASLEKSSDTALSFELPEVGTGYYIVSVMSQGLAGGELVHVDGTPPPAPLVSGPLLGQDVFTSRPTVTGTTEQGSKVKVSLRKKGAEEPRDDDAEAWAEARVGETGAWSYTPKADLDLGDLTLWVVATDEVGNNSEHTTIDFRFVQPQSHYGWNCASVPALPASGAWLLLIWLLRRVPYPNAARIRGNDREQSRSHGRCENRRPFWSPL
jgi:N-acetylneuraminic acid mutarotase